MPVNGEVHKYYMNTESVRVHYYQMLDNYVWAEAQQSQHDAVFLENAATPHSKRAVHSLLKSLFPKF